MAEATSLDSSAKARLAGLILRVLRSASLQSSALAAALGCSFTLANLLLARSLSVADYGEVALAIAFVTLGQTLGPLGQERMVVRHDLPATPALLRRGVASSLLVALVVSTVAFLAYRIEFQDLALIVPGMVAGGLALLASARFQSEKKYLLSTAVSQGSNLPLLLAAMLATLSGAGDRGLVLGIFTLGLGIVAAWSWAALLRCQRPTAAKRIDWREALAVTGIAGLLIIFSNLERFVIPLMLQAEDLAHFAVLAALIIAPFRMLQIGVGRTMVPRLRDAATAVQRRRLLLHETLLVGAVALTAGLVLACAVPIVEMWVLDGKYRTGPLLLAIITLAGCAKLFSSLATAAVSALADARGIYLANVTGWLALGLAILAASLGSRWGLSGLVAGIMLTTFCQAGLTLVWALPWLRGS